jgi:rare lipoprotein A
MILKLMMTILPSSINTLKTGLRLMVLVCIGASLVACGTTGSSKRNGRSKEYFAESAYGVKASPRVATGKSIPKGGGRYQVGKPYMVKGKWYYPKEDFGYNKKGLASWYGSAFHGRLTANGEVYDQAHLSAAHPTFPLPSYARVTNLETGSSVIVRVNDRGPYDRGRIIDLSNKAAELLDVKQKGTAKVQVQYVGRARMDGHDMPYLMASYVRKGDRSPAMDPGGQIATGVMVASNAKDMPSSAMPEAVPVPVNALQNPVPVPQSMAVMQNPDLVVVPPKQQMQILQVAQTDGQMFAMLPEFGPIPVERPVMAELAKLDPSHEMVAAYAEDRIAKAAKPFEAVLVKSHPLTEETIVSSFLRRIKQD